MKFIKTKLEGLWLIEPDVYTDLRGFFMEVYNKKEFLRQNIDVEFVQDNMSSSMKGTLRGLHYQLNPYAQGKLVRVTKGEVFDVAVDIRKASATFGQYFGCILSAENKRSLYVPPGFAHGFLVLSDEAQFFYKCTNYYAPEAQGWVVWNDPQIGVQWPAAPDMNLISEKDRHAPLLRDAELL